jgi:arylsulfatase A-like enzyme
MVSQIRIIFVLLIVFLANSMLYTAGASGGSHIRKTGEQPNIIFIMSDDQGYGDAGYMGHPVLQTPELDKMAETGLRFDRFYSASPFCSPTRASVITGRTPNRMGTFRWGNTIRPEERSVATLMRDAGYRTGFFGKWHLGSVRRGHPTGPDGHGFDYWYAAPNFYENDPMMSHMGTPVQVFGESSMVTVDLAIDYIREVSVSDQPFMVFIWFGAPHTPHDAIEELQELYPDQPESLRNFYGEITGIDRAVGRVRQELRDLGIAEQTMLMFSSDNGGIPDVGSELLNLRGRKGQVWEGGIRIPAVIEWPGKIKPQISDMPASTVDLFPTFLDIAGVEIPDDRPLDGISLVPLLNGEMGTRSQPLGFYHYHDAEPRGMANAQIVNQLIAYRAAGGMGEINEGVMHGPGRWEEFDDYPGWAAWMDGNWKLHRTEEHEYKLFNLANDPGEEMNILDEHPDRAGRMKRELRDWKDSVIGSLRGEDY